MTDPHGHSSSTVDSVIENIDRIARTPARRLVLDAVDVAIRAVQPTVVLPKIIQVEPDAFVVNDIRIPFPTDGRVYVLGFGKASAGMARVIEDLLGDRIAAGAVIDIAPAQLETIDVLVGTHPLPSKANLAATDRLLSLADEAGEHDLVLVLVSGGGSALFERPHGSLTELIATTDALIKSGATIHEINAVRKHASAVKGGWLAARARPARVVSLIISDVVGDDVSIIASGPTVFDASTISTAHKVLATYDISTPVLEETPKDPSAFDGVVNVLVATGEKAVSAAERHLRDAGIPAMVRTTHVTGIASDIGRNLARASDNMPPGTAFLYAGETTVVVTGDGVGGRNQEVCLAAVPYLNDDAVLVSVGTDGIDHAPVAGAIIDAGTRNAAAHLGFDSKEFLRRNDAYHFLAATDDLIVTGPTGTNVADVMILYRDLPAG